MACTCVDLVHNLFPRLDRKELGKLYCAALWVGNVCLDDDCAETAWGIIAINTRAVALGMAGRSGSC